MEIMNSSKKKARNPCKIKAFRTFLWQGLLALLAWSASHCSLFFHLSALPFSATGSGKTLRPVTLRVPRKAQKHLLSTKEIDTFSFLQRVLNSNPYKRRKEMDKNTEYFIQ